MGLTTEFKGCRTNPYRRLAQLSWMIGEGAMIYLYYKESAQVIPYRLLRRGLLLCEQLLVSSICTQQTIRRALQARKGSLAASLVPTLIYPQESDTVRLGLFKIVEYFPYRMKNKISYIPNHSKNILQ
jgi:hypothetical protein